MSDTIIEQNQQNQDQEESKKEENKQEDPIEKEKQRQIEIEKEKKKQQKKMKRERKKEKKLAALRELDSSREMSDDELSRKKGESKIWQNVGIPERLKQKYVDLEFNHNVVCVGNVPLSIQESELKEFFETVMITLRPALAIKPPVKEIEIGETKNFAIITLIDRESRNLCLKLDGTEFQGFKLQVCKPKGFFDLIYDQGTKQDPFGNISFGVEEQDGQLYMGNIPLYLRENEIKKICESFGMLKFFKLVQTKNDNGEWISKGYCFFEYADPKVTDLALQGLNKLELGKNEIRVSRAQPDSQMANVAETQQKEASNVVGGSYLASYPGIINPLIQKMIDIPLCAVTPSPVIQFLNMASPDDLVDDEFFAQLLEDIYEVMVKNQECGKFGNIEKIEIPRPDLLTGKVGPNVGKVFIKFDNLISAKKCRYHLNGRTYNKRTVIGSFYDEKRFDNKEYILKL